MPPPLDTPEPNAPHRPFEAGLEQVACARLPSRHAPDGFEVRAFREQAGGLEHLAILNGAPADGALVRVHSECLTGDALGSLRCDCGEQLQLALTRIGAEGGVLVYLRGQEGRGLGLANKIRAYALQDEGLDTVSANHALGFPDDDRDYAAAAAILRALGLSRVRLLSNNPRKTSALRAGGVTVLQEIALAIPPNSFNAAYLAAKRDRLGHRLDHSAPAPGDHAIRTR